MCCCAQVCRACLLDTMCAQPQAAPGLSKLPVVAQFVKHTTLSRTRDPFKTSPESSSTPQWPAVQSESRSGGDNSSLIGDEILLSFRLSLGRCPRRLPHRVSRLRCAFLIRVWERAISVTSSSADHVLRLRHTPDRIVARSFMSATHFFQPQQQSFSESSRESS